MLFQALLEWDVFSLSPLLFIGAGQMLWRLCGHSQTLHGHQICRQVRLVQEHQRVQGHQELRKHRTHHALPMVEPGNGEKLVKRRAGVVH